MPWTKLEKEQVNRLSLDVGEIRAVLVGNLKYDKPGLQDRVRDLEKRHKYTFALSAAALLGFVINMANGNVVKLIDWIVRSL